ncbi:hypothetical protein TNCT_175181 [Trichonephila clavata]|uniref:Uncharacterized protein n=1 Tax=Trichonephila clavata TaxID=2740835 RepID=A0A8X6HW56_TRICU|nr:hypothetical protein TNCT_175181 [Trichonephila clavata]
MGSVGPDLCAVADFDGWTGGTPLKWRAEHSFFVFSLHFFKFETVRTLDRDVKRVVRLWPIPSWSGGSVFFWRGRRPEVAGKSRQRDLATPEINRWAIIYPGEKSSVMTLSVFAERGKKGMAFQTT